MGAREYGYPPAVRGTRSRPVLRGAAGAAGRLPQTRRIRPPDTHIRAVEVGVERPERSRASALRGVESTYPRFSRAATVRERARRPAETAWSNRGPLCLAEPENFSMNRAHVAM